MDVNKVAKLLPEQPRPGMVDDVLRQCRYLELGGEFLIFRRVPITIEPELKRTMLMSDYEDHEKKTVKRWAAECRCTACSEEFIAGYENKNGLVGIKMYQGEDGQLYPDYVPLEYDDYDCIWLNSGASANCPYCGARAEVKAKSKLTRGRLYQTLVISIETAGEYAAIVTWLVRRELNSYGYWNTTYAIPRNAVVIDEKGRLHCFRHTEIHFNNDVPIAEWKPLKGYIDPTFKKYYNYSAVCHTQICGFTWENSADLTGTTGEKTGLQTYVEKGGIYPTVYLKLWKKYPQLENIVKSQFFDIFESEINYTCNQQIEYYGHGPESIEIKCLDLSEVKPHKMLHFKKNEFKHGMLTEWDWETAYMWLAHHWYIADMSATEYDEYISLLGSEAVYMLDGQTIDGEDWFSLSEVTKYLYKQQRKHNLPVCEGVQYLIDYREELYRQNANNLTHELLWPGNLLEAHDAIMETAAQLNDPKSYKNFKRIAKKYKPLEWNDGELCIRVARSNQELVNEGKTLRHCVGRYGTQHLSESDVIFFVRKYRRPERSYYTLDIRMNAGEPREIQLHGYGNEHHGKNKEYSHTIPQKVRDFCDRWKKEVLLPYYYKELAKQKKKESKSA
ncbi:MAG: PcfJ domain-containing protein [Clostridia bacterium]|nr:PcfJ domain-containing protein [Clostridia bacterium]